MRLRTILLAIFFLQFTTGLAGLPTDTSKTLIYIIGVNHKANQVRNADSLLTVLRDIKPDMILSETDTLSGYFKKDYTLVEFGWQYTVARALRLARPMPPEDEVIYHYRKEDPSVAVYPFDKALPERNKWVRNYLRSEQTWLDALQSAYEKGNVPTNMDSAYQSLIRLYTIYANTYQGSYRELNQLERTDSIRVYLQQEEQLSKVLIESVLALAQYKEWHNVHYGGWENRNQVMVQNIVRFTEKAKARKVVVFTGLMHKYYLIDKLGAEHYRQRYELVEYYENPSQ